MKLNIEAQIMDIIESNRLFNELTMEEKNLVLSEFETSDDFDNAVTFSSRSKDVWIDEPGVEVNPKVKQELIEKFRQKNNSQDLKQGSVISFVPGMAGLVKIGMAASLLFGSMIFTSDPSIHGDVFAADSASFHLDTSAFSLRDTSSMIKDTVTIR